MRAALPVLALLTLLAGAPAAGADEEAELRRLRREQLLRTARESVDPTNPAIGGLDDIRRLTQQQRLKFGADAPEVFQHLDTLVGTTEDGPRGASEGLIRQGARFHRWVVGQLRPEERHADPAAVKAWRDAKLEALVEEAREAHAAKTKGKAEGESPPAFDVEAETKRIRAQVAEMRVPIPEWNAKKPMYRVAPPDGEPVDLTATPPPDAGPLEEAVRAALVQGTLAVELVPGAETGAAGDVVALDGIRLLWDAAGLRPDKDNWRFPLVHPDELGWIESADYLGWRRIQVALRREALADTTIPSLVSDADVQVRKDRLQAFRDEQARLAGRAAAVRQGLDAMTEAQRHWQKELVTTGLAVEEWTTKCENCTEAEQAAFERELRRKQLEERAVQQELRLLFITALRAKARLDLLDTAQALANEEVVLAEASLQRYQSALSRTRRDAQLAELRLQAADLRRDLATAVKEGDDPALPAERRAVIVDYVAAVRRMLELNDRLTKLLRLRRKLEARAAGKTDIETARPPATAAPKAPPPGEEGPEAGASRPKTAEPPADPLYSVRDPASQDINAGYIDLVREKLGADEFDAALVAKHYAAADDALQTLQETLREVETTDPSPAAFDRIAEEVRSRIPPKPEYYWHKTYPSILAGMRTAYEDSINAIGRLRGPLEERVAVLRAWMEELEDLGVRSFAIRRDRTLGAEQLQSAAGDLATTARGVVKWAGLEGEHNAGTFAKRHWLPLTMLLAIVVMSVLVIRYGRRWIDERLTRMALKIPALRIEGVTIGTEAAEARQQREAIEGARREAEAAALANAAGAGEGQKGPVRGSAGEAGEAG